MKPLKKILILLVIPLFAFTSMHKFYVSVTNINYSEKDQALQITSRIFIDDMEQVLEERYGIKTGLATEQESKDATAYIEKYFKAKFALEINGEYANYTYLGKKYDDDMLVCYIEVPKVSLEQLKSIQIQNEILHDLFEEQQNLVHFKFKERKKSFVLIRENNKGMLNF